MLEALCRSRPRRFGPRDTIIGEGERPQTVSLFLDGWACRHKGLEDGRRQIISLFLPGDLCDINIFILKQMDHSISAVTPVTVAEVTREMFEAIVEGHPRIAQALWWESLVSAAIQREWTTSLGQRDAKERISHLLCELYVRLDCVGLVERCSCQLPLSQAEIGEMTGLTAVSVNRVLQDLRHAGLIDLKSRVLTIHDLPALERIALFNANYLHLEGEGKHLAANQ
ncbi:CRP/FNR family transcriptional regulator [Aurantimonas sp. 22II-16-19i]|nr:CRP/FNR family transcriptional regulator [Aurantimonas sp. 22II-16-19i]